MMFYFSLISIFIINFFYAYNTLYFLFVIQILGSISFWLTLINFNKFIFYSIIIMFIFKIFVTKFYKTKKTASCMFIYLCCTWWFALLLKVLVFSRITSEASWIINNSTFINFWPWLCFHIKFCSIGITASQYLQPLQIFFMQITFF